MKFAQKRTSDCGWMGAVLLREDEMALSHGQLMALLYAMHGAVTAEQTSKIRSRFKSLQKANMPAGDRPGRGTRAKYSFRQVCEVVLVFEFAKYNIDANLIMQFYDAFQDAVSALESISRSIIDNLEYVELSIYFTPKSLWSDIPDIGVYRASHNETGDIIWPLPPLPNRGTSILVLSVIAEDMIEVYPHAKRQR